MAAPAVFVQNVRSRFMGEDESKRVNYELGGSELERLRNEANQLFGTYIRKLRQLYILALELNGRLKHLKPEEVFAKKTIQIEWKKTVEPTLQEFYSIFNTLEEKLKQIQKLPKSKEVENEILLIDFVLEITHLDWEHTREQLRDLDKGVVFLQNFHSEDWDV